MMMRFEDYKKNNPKLYIYCNKGGQNWQILLPVLYKNKCGYLDVVTYNYVLRGDSHSHNLKCKDSVLDRFEKHKAILTNTLNILNMTGEERKYYEDLIEEKYIRFKLYYASKTYDQELLNENYRLLDEKKLLTKKDKIEYFKGKNIIYNICIRTYLKVKRMLKG